MSAKAALYIAVRETGISKSELARRLGVDEKEIRRMLSPRHQTKLPRIEQALSALGYQLSVSLLKAAYNQHEIVLGHNGRP
jgi:antitoxin HicB